MKVVAFARTGGMMGISAVRALWPMQALRELGHETVVLGDAEVQWMVDTGDERVLDGADIIQLTRIHAEPTGDDPWAKARASGTKIVYDCDDDLTDSFRDLGEGHRVADAVRLADAVTVSTPHLAEVMQRFGKPVYVLPNYIDTAWYEQKALEAERHIRGVTVGFVGTPSHFFDWLVVLPALKAVKERYPHVVVVLGGYRAPYMEQIPGVQFVQPVPFEYYPAMLAQVDIRLCPIDVEDRFNWSKSAIAAMEIMAATRTLKGTHLGGGIPIATDDLRYREILPHGSGMLVENTTEAWVEAISAFLADKGLRLRTQAACQEYVQNFDIRHGAAERERVYKEIING